MRRKLRTILGLNPVERALLRRAWFRLLAAGLALRFLPLPKVQALLGAGSRRPLTTPVPTSRIAGLVAAAARNHLLTLHCLPRALVLQSLLGDQGIQADLRIGVRRREKEMEAHAWVEQDGRVVGDSPELVRRYLPLEPHANPGNPKPSPGLP